MVGMMKTLMSRAHATREIWHPKSSEDKAAVLRQLDEILNSPQFRNSKRYPALLEYVVRNTLAGRADELKERTLGVEVFNRPPTYDTNADTIVRYTAGEVRKRLLLYYSDSGQNSSLRISLPAGSYVPEFSFELDEHESPVAVSGGQDGFSHEAGATLHPGVHSGVHPEVNLGPDEHSPPGSVSSPATLHSRVDDAADHAAIELVPKSTRRTHMVSLAAAVLVVLAVAAAGLLWKDRALHPNAAVDEFWAPVLHDQRNVVICTGSVVFAQNNNYSGVHTASKDPDYSFVSMQIASAIAQVSDVAEESGTSAQLTSAASTPLTQLREHPVILLGGYNNQWTLRMLDPLRFHFAQPDEAILDRMRPSNQWKRDRSLPYSSADDYAVVARFRNPTIDSWVVVLAGLGRNGTEAAAQFATSPHYMELLRSRVGNGFAASNVEAVLKVNVIDGKTGAPSILAVYAW
jgi:hypothetical protein